MASGFGSLVRMVAVPEKLKYPIISVLFSGAGFCVNYPMDKVRGTPAFPDGRMVEIYPRPILRLGVLDDLPERSAARLRNSSGRSRRPLAHRISLRIRARVSKALAAVA